MLLFFFDNRSLFSLLGLLRLTRFQSDFLLRYVFEFCFNLWSALILILGLVLVYISNDSNNHRILYVFIHRLPFTFPLFALRCTPLVDQGLFCTALRFECLRLSLSVSAVAVDDREDLDTLV